MHALCGRCHDTTARKQAARNAEALRADALSGAGLGGGVAADGAGRDAEAVGDLLSAGRQDGA
jgi:hypothetical protein